MQISIVIPARDAAATLARTLDSLLAQRFAAWEAIIVDDGSADDTGLMTERYAARDPRFVPLHQTASGVASARNRGISAARFDHLLFLDADDWLLPDHLQRLSGLLEEDPSLDAAVCGWAHVTPAGEFVFEQREGEQGDLFRAHAQYCYSLIHTYLLRRPLVEAAGGFDVRYRTCEDWDLFQRIARAGCRFGRVPEVLAAYRMRHGSATANGLRLLEDGMQVLRNGHGVDDRVADPHPVHPFGLPAEELPPHLWGHACTCAGYLLGGGDDALPLLDGVVDVPPVPVRASDVARGIFVHTMVAAARPVAEWPRIWEESRERRLLFLTALEERLAQRRLAAGVEENAARLLGRYVGGAKVRRLPKLSWVAESARRRGQVWRGALRRITAGAVRATSPLEHAWSRMRRATGRRRGAAPGEDYFEQLFVARPDPWDTENEYEFTKAEQAVAFLPEGEIGDALEVGCAEGHMTWRLAGRVRRLVAADVSRTALLRAARRCEGRGNIEFLRQDCLAAPPDGPFDLIVCSEVLYYCADQRALRCVAGRLSRALRPGGHLLLAHANCVTDDPCGAGFDWGQPFGAKVIRDTFGRRSGLKLVREGRAPLYGVQLFRRSRGAARAPEPEPLQMADPLPASVLAQAIRDEGRRLPVLVYGGGIAGSGSTDAAEFHDHVEFLHASGARSVSLEEWRRARDYRVPLAGSVAHVVLDEVHSGWFDEVRRVLEVRGWCVTLILRVDPRRDRLLLPDSWGPSAWRDVRRLQGAGLRLGAGMPVATWEGVGNLRELMRLLRGARAVAHREIAQEVTVLQIPPGRPWAWRHRWCAGAAGFDFVLGGGTGIAEWSDSLLALPVLQVHPGTAKDVLCEELGLPQESVDA